MRAVGGVGTSWERQPGQRSFGLDMRGPWAWAALPKRRGLGGPALSGAAAGWSVRRPPQPTRRPLLHAPSSGQPRRALPPWQARVCPPTRLHVHTGSYTLTHAQRRRLVLTTAHAPTPLPTPEATGLPGACAGTRLAPCPEAACSRLESTKTPEAPGGALGPPEQSGQGRSSLCRDHMAPFRASPADPPSIPQRRERRGARPRRSPTWCSCAMSPLLCHLAAPHWSWCDTASDSRCLPKILSQPAS